MEGAVQREETVRSLLARLLFGDELRKPAGVLSGGERIRLGFAKLFASECRTCFCWMSPPIIWIFPLLRPCRPCSQNMRERYSSSPTTEPFQMPWHKIFCGWKRGTFLHLREISQNMRPGNGNGTAGKLAMKNGFWNSGLQKLPAGWRPERPSSRRKGKTRKRILRTAPRSCGKYKPQGKACEKRELPYEGNCGSSVLLFWLTEIWDSILFTQHHTGPSTANHQTDENPSAPPEIPAGLIRFKDYSIKKLYSISVFVSLPPFLTGPRKPFPLPYFPETGSEIEILWNKGTERMIHSQKSP